MGYKRFEDILTQDKIDDRIAAPWYDCNGEDTWYLGLAGELAAEVKCERLLLPMLSQERFNWKDELEKALIKAASLQPLRTVANFKEAVWNFSTQVKSIDLDISVGSWFGDAETVNTLKSSVKYKSDGHYQSELHSDVDRQGVSIDLKKSPKGSVLQSKTIIIIPKCEYFGVLATTNEHFNFLFHPNKIFRYHLKNLEIGDGHNLASGG